MKNLLIFAVSALVLGAAAGCIFWRGGKSPLAIELERAPAAKADYGGYEPYSLLQSVFVTEYDDVFAGLAKARAAVGTETPEKLGKLLLSALNIAGNYENYYIYKDRLSLEIEGTRYGAFVEPGESPIGGGAGYLQIVRTGDYTPETLDELIAALESAQPGQVVFLRGDAVFDLTMIEAPLSIPEGVTLASDRGATRKDGSVSPGARLEMNRMRLYSTVNMAANSRLSGIVLRGPTDRVHGTHWHRAFRGTKDWRAGGSSYYYKLPFGMGAYIRGDDCEVDNCEIAAFNYTGVEVFIGYKNANIHHNYIHHNRGHGLAYGVCLHDDSTADIRYNLFNAHRHSIAATGAPVQGYIAAHNVEMGGDVYKSHNFDIHGGADRGDGTDIAGTYCEMFNNTFLVKGADPYYRRGTPEDYSVFYHNLLINSLYRYNLGYMVGENLTHYDNVFDIEDPTVVEGERLPGKP